jgi:signal transduction histidine kinase
MTPTPPLPIFDSHPPEPEVARSWLRRIHHLSNATEQVFSRLYRNLGGQPGLHSQLDEAQADLALTERRNRRLRRLLRNSQMEISRLQAILEAISEGIIMQDLDGRILYMNQAAYQILGSESKFWNSELAQLFSAVSAAPDTQAELVPLGEPHKLNIGSRMLSVQLAAVNDSQKQRIGTLIVLRDATQDELNERIKHSFVMHISHELRTPLAPMRIASEILLNTPEDQAPNQRMLEMISRNVDILDRMVNEMIDLSAMTAGALEIRHEPVQLAPLIGDLYEEFRLDAKNAKIELLLMTAHAESLTLVGDEKFLRWSISNLLRNAIQYNERGGRVDLRVKRDIRQSRPHIVLEVRDTGVGIRDEDLPKIFDLFYRGEARTKSGKRLDPRGLGQGLYVARTIAHAHGGALSVESRLHEGTKFRLILPAGVMH